jgi:mannosyltransferase OCH1-like enzyme
MIPRIFFTYWEGDQLSELHYFTIYSLHKYNPNDTIYIYTSLYETDKLVEWHSYEHNTKINNKIKLDEIINISQNIKLIKINFKEEYNIMNNISCVYKADFIRIAKLYEHGGMWFDMDILFIEKIPNNLFNTDTNTILFTYSDTIPTGLLLSTPKSELLTILYNSALTIIQNKNMNDYQIIGPNLWRQCHLKSSKKNMIFYDNSYVYPYDWITFTKFFNSNDDSYIKKNTFGIHWYNGNPITKEFINSNPFLKDCDAEKNICFRYIKKLYIS